MTKAPVRLADGRAGGRVREHFGEALAHAEDAPEAVRAALAAFVAGFGMGPEQGDGLLVERLLPGACARCRACPEEDAGACATLHAEQVFETWLTAVLGAERLAGQPALPVGRAAYLACGGPTNWPDLVLVDEALPEVFVVAMRAAAPSLAPLSTPGTMSAQSLETWSFAEAGRAAAEILDENLAWLTHARPLIAVPIKLASRPHDRR